MSEYTPKLEQAKVLNRWAVVLTVIILAAVVAMRRISLDLPFETKGLPAVYSILNAIVAVVLIYALIQIKKKNIEKHKTAMMTAMALSAGFLILYVLYHISNDPVSYCQEGVIRYVYFTLLIAHIVAAAVIFPFILFTFVKGFTNQFEKHKKLARWVFPVWLFVCVSGPVNYLMLMPCH